MTQVFENQTGRLFISTLPDGRYELRGEGSKPGTRVPHSPYVTTYPLDLVRLVFEAYGAVHTCDEISRDTDETEALLDVRYSVMAYFDDGIFSRDLSILDYGCGAGSSTIALARLFPNARITGLDFVDSFLSIGKLRAKHYDVRPVSFQQVAPSGDVEGSVGGAYDLVFLNAVYEHLLPAERPSVIASIWNELRVGGALILNQTPHRWFPIETHTSGLPLINYFPRAVAMWAIRKFSTRDIKQWSWDQLLRAGVRGATVTEILGNIHSVDPSARILAPSRISTSWAGIWYAAKRARLGKLSSSIVRHGISSAESFVKITRLPISPYINIAVTKVG